MPQRHRRSTGLVRGQRRKLVWATTNQTGVSLPLAGTGTSDTDLLAVFGVAGASTLGITVMRTILKLQATGGFTANSMVNVGTVVGKSADVGINQAGQVSPQTPELDWNYLTTWPLTSTTDPEDTVLQADIRSKRKMQELSQRYVLSVQVGTVAPGPFVFNIFARVLIALP